MTLHVYNTLSRQKEPFRTIEPGVVRMYVCGVTVYDQAHIGHAMSSIIFDVLRRYVEHRGFRVRYVQNFTDVDDKVIRRANAEGLLPFEVADRYARQFLLEQERLGILAATLNPRVSSEIPAILELVQRIIDRGHAYVAANGDVYFDVRSFPRYGALSRRSLEEALSQGEPEEHKRDPLDFALWKAAKPGEPHWPSPWGAGRPGWHIECSAMSMRYLGEQIDIHGGGTDLVFPHHENEIAQSEAASGLTPFCRFWVHNGLLQIGDEKMSKSLGNFVPVADFLAAHEADAFRLMVLSSHYRKPMLLSDAAIAAAEAGLDRLRSALRPAGVGVSLDPASKAAEVALGPTDPDLAKAVEEADGRFHEAMDDDFGTPGALAALFDLVTAIHKARASGVGAESVAAAQRRLIDLAAILGFRLAARPSGPAAGVTEAAPFVQLLLDIRDEARAARNWQLADRVRDGLARLGVMLEDTRTGTEWRVRER